MATKHIEERLWRDVEKATIKCVTKYQANIKEGQMLRFLIEEGLKVWKEEGEPDPRRTK